MVELIFYLLLFFGGFALGLTAMNLYYGHIFRKEVRRQVDLRMADLRRRYFKPSGSSKVMVNGVEVAVMKPFFEFYASGPTKLSSSNVSVNGHPVTVGPIHLFAFDSFICHFEIDKVISET